MKDILQQRDPVLRHIAHEVPIHDIPSASIQKVIVEMKEALTSQDDGVAIAAPQIGHSLRIFVISKKVFKALAEKKKKEVGEKSDVGIFEDVVCINPIFIKKSRDKKAMEEGCLSVRYLYGTIRRSTRATIECYNEHGVHLSLSGSGLLAQIFQHEIDHLDGVLFIDNATNVHEVLPEESKK